MNLYWSIGSDSTPKKLHTFSSLSKRLVILDIIISFISYFLQKNTIDILQNI